MYSLSVSVVLLHHVPLLTNKPRANRMRVRLKIFWNILTRDTCRLHSEWNENTMDTPMIHMNLLAILKNVSKGNYTWGDNGDHDKMVMNKMMKKKMKKMIITVTMMMMTMMLIMMMTTMKMMKADVKCMGWKAITTANTHHGNTRSATVRPGREKTNRNEDSKKKQGNKGNNTN